MAHLSQWRGLPIPWLVPVDAAGTPNFAMNNMERVIEAITKRLCGQCGSTLEYWIAFLGDEGDCGRGWFTEPPMHEECARYAMSVCPYLNHGIYKGRQATSDEKTIVLYEWTRQPGPRPRWGLYITRQYRPWDPPKGPIISIAAPPKRLEWFD